MQEYNVPPQPEKIYIFLYRVNCERGVFPRISANFGKQAATPNALRCHETGPAVRPELVPVPESQVQDDASTYADKACREAELLQAGLETADARQDKRKERLGGRENTRNRGG